MKALGRIAPFVIAAIAVAAVLRRYSLHDIAVEMRAGRALAAAPWAALLAVGYMVLAAYADTLVLRAYRSTHGSPRWRDVVRGKAAAAMLTSIGYLFGNGGYGVWIARATGVGARAAAALVLLFMLSDLGAVGWVASVAGATAESAPRGLRIAAAVAALVPTALVLVAPSLPASVPLLRMWRAVPRGRGLAQIAVRCAAITVAVGSTFAGARAFGLAIPWPAAARFGPAILLVASLPVNVAGVGAVQSAWLLFFAPYEAGARIVAFALLWQWMSAAAFVLRGLPFVRRAVGQIAVGTSGADANAKENANGVD